jgi:hypothetical protein
MHLRADRRETRQNEAKERQLARAKLTPQQQIQRLDDMGYASKSERRRLEAQLAPKVDKTKKGGK